jgi:hypothetical protein
MLKLLFLLIALTLIVVAVLLPPLGCQPNRTNISGDSGLRTVQMRIGRKTFTLEVADTDATRQLGLMYRDSLPANRGMLFIFPDEQRLGFWMKNTRIPLDIIYLDSAGQVVCIRQMKPFDERSVPSGSPARFAIELNQGAAAAVKVGDKLAIPTQPATSPSPK